MTTVDPAPDVGRPPRDAGNAARLRPRLFWMFVVYARSGHSLVGPQLDTHPDVIVPHDVNASSLVDQAAGAAELFAAILDSSRRLALERRKETGYPYAVSGQSQGRFRRLTVIGDKQGGRAAGGVEAAGGCAARRGDGR